MAIKGAVVSLLDHAYEARKRVAIVKFSGKKALLILKPRRAPKRVDAVMSSLRGGGGTPLGQGLNMAMDVFKQQRKRYRLLNETLVLFTDGRSQDTVSRGDYGGSLIIVDSETGPIRLNRSKALARVLHAEYLHITQLPKEN